MNKPTTEMIHSDKYKANMRIDNPEKILDLRRCTAIECAMKCMTYGCAVFVVSKATCKCELTFAYDVTARAYTESAAPGFDIYKFY